jgi:hypothetical protein
MGAQAIAGTFLTVATSVAEAEAHIASAQDRFWRRAIKLWTDIYTLPETNPLRRNSSRMRKCRRQHRSPLYQVAEAFKDIAMEELETINPCILAPWERRVQTITHDSASKCLDADWGVRIAVSSSARNGVVRMGGAMEVRKSACNGQRCEIMSFSSTLGKRDEHNPYSGELAAMANALTTLPKLRFRRIVMMTRNKAAALTLRKPRQQSGQEYINRIYGATRALERDGSTITVL